MTQWPSTALLMRKQIRPDQIKLCVCCVLHVYVSVYLCVFMFWCVWWGWASCGGVLNDGLHWRGKSLTSGGEVRVGVMEAYGGLPCRAGRQKRRREVPLLIWLGQQCWQGTRETEGGGGGARGMAQGPDRGRSSLPTLIIVTHPHLSSL